MSKHSTVSMKQRKVMFYLYIVFLFVITIGIFIMPISSDLKEKSAMLIYVSGTAFWVGLLGTIITAVKINSCRKKDKKFNEEIKDVKKSGLFCFFQNKEAKVVDICMFIAIVGFIISRLCFTGVLISFIFFASIVFTFGLHCMLNSVNYRYIKNQTNRGEES